MACNFADGVLTILAGQTCELSSNHPRVLQGLVMESGSTLVVRGVDEWKVDIKSASIADDCRWDLRGADGPNASGERPPSRKQSEYCQDGKKGRAGAEGGRGVDGINLEIKIGLSALGSLTIDASGGKGGNGGPGGKGGKGGAGRFGCSYSGDGGRGGKGGRGGGGGDTGEVLFQYWWTESADASFDIEEAEEIGLRFASEPGSGGQGGPGGSPGKRGEKNDAGSKGSRGKKGADGGVGAQGTDVPEVVELIRVPD